MGLQRSTERSDHIINAVAVDRTLYRLRNLVERCFNKLKNARRVATRYDKSAESFLAFIDITSIRLWLRYLST